MPAAEAITTAPAASPTLVEQLEAAVAAAAEADRAYRAYLADDSDLDDRDGTVDATNAADAEVDRLRALVIAQDVEREWQAEIDGGQGGDTTLTATSVFDAIEQAAEWTRDGDWCTDSGTVHASVRVHCELTGETRERTVSIDAPEPACIEGESHSWKSPHEIVGGIAENPGVRGKGGGTVSTECCMRCGCARTTDTWAQDRSTGEQGLTAVTYEEGRYADEIPAREERELAAIGCDEMRACAAYVLACLRSGDSTIRDSIPRKSRERAAQVGCYVHRVLRAVPTRHESRAVRVALWLAARDQSEADAAEAVHAAWQKGR